MDISSIHQYSKYKNQTLKWLGTDTEEAWIQNLKDPVKQKILETYNWHLPDCITYKFNSHGFRCAEFSNKAGFIALGCSFTVGIGLPAEQTWVAEVANVTGLEAWNLGIGGSSMDTCFRIAVNYIEQLKPKYVLLLTPNPTRFELFNYDEPYNILPNQDHHKEIKQAWYASDQNQTVNFYKNILAIEYICKINNVKLIIKDSYNDLSIDQAQEPYPTARDLKHNGAKSHIFCANKFLDLL